MKNLTLQMPFRSKNTIRDVSLRLISSSCIRRRDGTKHKEPLLELNMNPDDREDDNKLISKLTLIYI